MTETPVFELKEVRMNYGAGDVLRGVSFSLPRGKIVALLGLNGAGKSTLMHLLAGLLAPTGGTLSKNTPVAMVAQELSLLPDLSVGENLLLPRLNEFRRFGAVRWNAVHRHAAQALDRVGLKIDTRTPVSLLSTGEMQLVEIARALDQNAGLLILDEPTSALTRGECSRLFAILRRLVEQSGTTVLFCSHRLDEVREISDEVLVLKDGRLETVLKKDEAANTELEQRIIAAMTGETSPSAQTSRPVSIASRGKGTAPTKSMARTKSMALRVDHLEAHFKGSLLARIDAPLEIPSGKSVGIAGLMGSGRSVLLRSIASRLNLAANGMKIPAADLKGAFELRTHLSGAPTAYLHEDRKTAGLFADLSACENIAAAERGNNRIERASRLFHTLGVRAAVKADEALDLPAHSFSGGNQQKLLLGRALLSGAKFLILDEPTRGVDASARRDIFVLLRRFLDDGGSVLWTSSDFEELCQESDHIYVMSRGRLSGQPLRPESGAKLTSLVLEKESTHVQ